MRPAGTRSDDRPRQVPSVRFPLAGQNLGHLAQLVAPAARPQPSCTLEKVLGLQQPVGRIGGDLPSRRRDRLATLLPGNRLSNPGFPGKPCVIGAANRAARAREEYGGALKALAIGLDAGGDRPPRKRTFDHDHTHVLLSLGSGFFLDLVFLDLAFVASCLRKEAGRSDHASSQVLWFGGHRTVVRSSMGGMLAGSASSNRPGFPLEWT
jgi:hypothetical protein